MEVVRRNFALEERLLEYAAALIRFAETMRQTQAGNHFAGQLLRSGTAPLPNHGEAQAAESMADFVHQMSLALKELRGSRRGLRLAQRVPLGRVPGSVDPLIRETEELIRLFFASIATARKRAIRKGGVIGR